MNLSRITLGLAVAGAALINAGCASHSHELVPADVSTSGYKAMSCKELHVEAAGNISELFTLGRQIDETATDDQNQAILGAVLFWPALFALEGGDGPEAAKYSRMTGEINAIEKVSILNECPEVLAVIKDYRDKTEAARIAAKKAQTSQWD